MNNSKHSDSKPPRLADIFLHWRLSEAAVDEVMGDLHEMYHKWTIQYGHKRAKQLYWISTVGFLRPLPGRLTSNRKKTSNANSSSFTTIAMFPNYFKIARRKLQRNPLYTIINIGGLAVGMTVAILISLWIYDELSFNKKHENYNRIAQVLQNQHVSGHIETYESLPLPVASVLRNTYGNYFEQIAATVSLEQFISNQGKVFTRRGFFSEHQFPGMMSLEMVSGDRNSLNEPGSVLLSESLASILFRSDNPLNKTVKLNNEFALKVSGIYKDLPKNSAFSEIKFIAPLSLLLTKDFDYDNWRSSSYQLYTLLKEQNSIGKVQDKIKDVLYNNSKDPAKPELILNPMSKWHLYEFKNGQLVAGRAQFVWLFGIINVLVLLLASINFMNLSTAQSAKRAREVGIRKTIGSRRVQLIYQFFSECFLIVLIATLLAIIGVSIALKGFNELADKQLAIPVYNVQFWLLVFAFILFTVLISGTYPAIYLSSFKPIKVLKGVIHTGRLATVPRKLLVVMQFTVSIALIIATLIVYRQIQFAKNRPTGYDRERLVTIPMNNPEIFKYYNAFKNDLLRTNQVEDLSRSSSPTTAIASSANNLDWPGKNPNEQMVFGTILIDPSYGQVIKWKILSGRDFSNEIISDSTGFIFNESAIRLMGLKNPIGETVKWHGKNWQVLGVVKDMVMKSPFDRTMPTVFLMDDKERNFNVIQIKIRETRDANMVLKTMEATYKKYCPDAPFDYKFTDDAYTAKFKAEERIGDLAALFASLAVFLSCLGLFGLASYVAEQRTREIGVRKVLGATVFNLWKMLSKDFLTLVFFSCLIAVPIAWYLLEDWLRGYEYRTKISWTIFLVASLCAIVLSTLTVSYHVIKAALTSPVKSLKTE